MARFEVQGPDGKRYEIQAPDQAAAMEAFGRMNSTAPATPSVNDPRYQTSFVSPANPGGIDGPIAIPPVGQRGEAAAPAADQGFGNNVAQQAGDGVFFGFGDEISARLNAMTGYDANTGTYGNSTTYDDQLAAVRGQERQFEQSNPYIAAGSEIAGGLVPALAGVGAVTGGGSLFTRMARGAGVGAGMGAAYGFGEGEGLADRAGDGLLSGLVGGAVGGAIPAVAEAGRSVYRMGQDAYRNSRIGGQIGQQLGVSPQAGRFIGDAIAAENPADMMAALNRAGPDAMLADASPALAGRLDATMRSPVAGAGLARQRVDDRAGAAFYDVMDAIDPGQGPRMGPIAQQNAMRAQARPGVNAAYQQAYNTPIDYASDAGREIESLVKRLPSGTAQRAIRSANERMAYDGTPAAQIMASIADDGTVTMQQMPNVMQLDYLKRAFDEIARDGTDPVTRSMNSDASFASRIARDIREATADAVPAYREALSSAASDIRQRGAMDTGASLLRPQTTVEEVARSVSEATPAELRAMRQGVVGQMRHILGNVRAIATDQNIEPRQAMQALRELSSPNSQAKLEAVYGEAWPSIKQSIDQASAALGLRASTSSNSATAARMMADREITESVTPGALARMKPLEAASDIAAGVLGYSPQAINRVRDEVKAEIADILTRQGGVPRSTIQRVMAVMNRNPSNPNAGNALRKVITASGLSSIPGLNEALLRLEQPQRRVAQ